MTETRLLRETCNAAGHWPLFTGERKRRVSLKRHCSPGAHTVALEVSLFFSLK